MPIPKWLEGTRAGDLFVEHILSSGLEIQLSTAELHRLLAQDAERWTASYLDCNGGWWTVRTGGQPYVYPRG